MSENEHDDERDDEIDPAEYVVTAEERAAAIERFKDATPILNEIFSGSSNSRGIDADFGFDTPDWPDGEDD